MNAPSVRRRFRVAVDHQVIAGIPCLRLERNESGIAPCGCLVHLHGSDASKETDLLLGLELAEAGFSVVLPDAPLHGERASVARVTPLETIHRVLKSAATEVEALSEALEGEGYSRLALSGRSLGGVRAIHAAVACPRVARLSLIVSGGDFRTLLQRTSNAAIRSEETLKALAAGFLDAALALDPVVLAPALPPMPVWLGGAVEDHVVPIECVRALSAALSGRKQFAYAEYPGQGHALSPSMIADLVRWHSESAGA